MWRERGVTSLSLCLKSAGFHEQQGILRLRFDFFAPLFAFTTYNLPAYLLVKSERQLVSASLNSEEEQRTDHDDQ